MTHKAQYEVIAEAIQDLRRSCPGGKWIVDIMTERLILRLSADDPNFDETKFHAAGESCPGH